MLATQHLIPGQHLQNFWSINLQESLIHLGGRNMGNSPNRQRKKNSICSLAAPYLHDVFMVLERSIRSLCLDYTVDADSKYMASRPTMQHKTHDALRMT